MISAIDSNILLDILIPNPAFADGAADALEDAAVNGALVISDIVYAEISVHFTEQKDCDLFFADSRILVEPLTREAHFLASRVWRRYRAQGGKRTRILADFLVGAHAQLQADQLITRDRGFYGSLFPGLKISEPSGQLP
jgi:predicted nucleic acid-binding protein